MKGEFFKRDSWAVRQRMAFMHFQLEVIGFINRSDLIESFGISTPQASADIRRYIKMGMDLEYNMCRKRYETYPLTSAVGCNGCDLCLIATASA